MKRKIIKGIFAILALAGIIVSYVITVLLAKAVVKFTEYIWQLV